MAELRVTTKPSLEPKVFITPLLKSLLIPRIDGKMLEYTIHGIGELLFQLE